MRVPHLLRAGAAVFAILTVMGGMATAKEWTRIRLGTSADDPPSSSVRTDGTLEGFEIDLAADVCKRMRVQCEWVRHDFASLIPALLEDKIDMISVVLAMTPQRRETIAFSTPILGNRQGFLVRKSGPLASVDVGNTDVVSLDDSSAVQPVIDALARVLQGKVVGTDAGGARVDVAKQYFKGVELRTYLTPPDVRRELLAGHIDADFGRMEELEQPDSSELQRMGPWLTGGVFGPGADVGLRKTDPELKAMLDTAIKAALADGTIKALSLKYYHHWVPPM